MVVNEDVLTKICYIKKELAGRDNWDIAGKAIADAMFLGKVDEVFFAIAQVGGFFASGHGMNFDCPATKDVCNFLENHDKVLPIVLLREGYYDNTIDDWVEKEVNWFVGSGEQKDDPLVKFFIHLLAQ